MIVMGVLAFLSGISGYLLAKKQVVYLLPHWADKIETEKHGEFLSAAWAHSASYLSGLLGGIILCIITLRKRSKLNGRDLQHG